LDRNRVAENVEHWAVSVDRLGKFLVPSGGVRSCQADPDSHCVEPRADLIIDAKEPTKVDIAFDFHIDFVELHSELSRPNPIADGLARTKRSQGVFDRIWSSVAAA
jgi:hypothetical protein